MRRSGRGLLALPRATFVALSVAAAMLLTACGQPHASRRDSPPTPMVGTAQGGSSFEASGPSGSGETNGLGAGVVLPTRIGGVDLTVTTYDGPAEFEGSGADEFRAMLEELGVESRDVSLVMAVDGSGALAIGRWAIPGRNADTILSAWLAATSGWVVVPLDQLPAATGTGPDGSRGWAAARDGVFIYVVAQDRSLAQAALLATS